MNHELITRDNFEAYVYGTDTLDLWRVIREAIAVAQHQNEVAHQHFTWTLDQFDHALEKMRRWPELFVPALNNALNVYPPEWEVRDGDEKPWRACGECVYTRLREDGRDVELNEPYSDDEEELYVSLVVLAEGEKREWGQRCGCGVILE